MLKVRKILITWLLLRLTGSSFRVPYTTRPELVVLDEQLTGNCIPSLKIVYRKLVMLVAGYFVEIMNYRSHCLERWDRFAMLHSKPQSL